jgi:hypothetical protein
MSVKNILISLAAFTFTTSQAFSSLDRKEKPWERGLTPKNEGVHAVFRQDIEDLQPRQPAERTKESDKLNHYLGRTHGTAHQCSFIIDRMNKGPDDYREILEGSRAFSDPTMSDFEMVYWEDYPNTYGDLSYLFDDGYVDGYGRMFDMLKNETLWGSDAIDFTDVYQGYIGDCYLLAAASGVAMKRLDIANVFALKEPNDQGIAALNMYLKGKPTIITIDDTIPVDSNGNPVLALLGDTNAIWPLLIEKAFAKMYGNFENIVGGWT